jgi:hypothetical protein
MRLSKELVEQFQALHFKKYGESIDYQTAELQLNELAELVRITAPISEDKQSA